jgi:hypothetical protein
MNSVYTFLVSNEVGFFIVAKKKVGEKKCWIGFETMEGILQNHFFKYSLFMFREMALKSGRVKLWGLQHTDTKQVNELIYYDEAHYPSVVKVEKESEECSFEMVKLNSRVMDYDLIPIG